MSLWRSLSLLLFLSLTLSPAAICAVDSSVGANLDACRENGEKAFSQNNYGLAEKNFLAALKFAETQNLPATDLRWATAYKNLAALYDVRSQFPKSEMYLERELRARERALGSENPQVITSVSKLCRFYLLHGNQPKADRLDGLLITYSERVLKDEQQLDAHFGELDKFFATHNEYAEPEKKFKLAKEEADHIRADDHLELANNLDAVAQIYKDHTKYPVAERMYKLSISLREKSLAPGHLALAFGYENLGNLYVAMGKTDLAQPLFQKALDVTNKTLDFKRPEVYSRLDSLARTYISMGQIAQAEALYKRALTLLKDNGGTKSRDFGSASFALASLYMKQGQFSQAEPLLKTAVTISESINGPQSVSLVALLDTYAEALDKTSRGSEAAKIRHKANTIRGNSSACDTAQTAGNF